MGEVQREAKCSSGRCDNFVEQREHSSMAPYVVDVDKRGAPVQRAHDFDGKIVRLAAVTGYPVSRDRRLDRTA